ncbi:hypothetical protein INT45_000538 [Circinella minor]|uniref:RING-type E3 ubiquitin transferase n=1 Tax=Circinella minor TaxID=1195481 RepID=A0A8H7VMR9_9FUNG|nr:hypothetical protein INT45_000538 [Circinella minor]
MMTGGRISLKYRFLYCTTPLLLFLALSLQTTVTATIVVLATNETFPDRLAAFGPSLSSSQGKLGYLMEPTDDPTGCQIVQPPCDDWVALVRRGGCSFVSKVRNMQNSGAIAVAIGDPDQTGWVTMYAPGDTSDIYIPSVFLAQREYQALKYLANFVDTPMMVLLLQIDNWLEWPLMHLVILIFVSPSIVMTFLYISFKLRQRQKLKQDLAPLHIVSRLAVRRFSREKMGENDAEECAICLEDYMDGEKLRVLPCRHTFHTFCVDAWLTTQKKFCPICKRDITTVPDSVHPEATRTIMALQL